MGAKFSAPDLTGPGAHPASYTMGTGSFPGVKRPGRGVNHPPTSSFEVKIRVELYLYSPSGHIVLCISCICSISHHSLLPHIQFKSLATSWKVWRWNPGGGEIFRTSPDRLWGPPSLLYNGYRVSFPGVKWPGRGVDRPPASSFEVKIKVELYLYSPSESSWPVLG